MPWSGRFVAARSDMPHIRDWIRGSSDVHLASFKSLFTAFGKVAQSSKNIVQYHKYLDLDVAIPSTHSSRGILLTRLYGAALPASIPASLLAPRPDDLLKLHAYYISIGDAGVSEDEMELQNL